MSSVDNASLRHALDGISNALCYSFRRKVDNAVREQVQQGSEFHAQGLKGSIAHDEHYDVYLRHEGKGYTVYKLAYRGDAARRIIYHRLYTETVPINPVAQASDPPWFS